MRCFFQLQDLACNVQAKTFDLVKLCTFHKTNTTHLLSLSPTHGLPGETLLLRRLSAASPPAALAERALLSRGLRPPRSPVPRQPGLYPLERQSFPPLHLRCRARSTERFAVKKLGAFQRHASIRDKYSSRSHLDEQQAFRGACLISGRRGIPFTPDKFRGARTLKRRRTWQSETRFWVPGTGAGRTTGARAARHSHAARAHSPRSGQKKGRQHKVERRSACVKHSAHITSVHPHSLGDPHYFNQRTNREVKTPPLGTASRESDPGPPAMRRLPQP